MTGGVNRVNIRHRKLWGIPALAIIVVIGMIICTGSGFAIASFVFTRNYTANIKVMADKVGVYQDSNCSVAFNSDVLTFNDIWIGQDSQPVRLYLRNEGGSVIYPKMNVSNLSNGLTVKENTYNQIATSPDWTNLYVPHSVIWTSNGVTANVTHPVSLDASEIYMDLDISAINPNGYVKIGDEIIGYANATVIDGKNCLRYFNRGQYGTLPAEHQIDDIISFGTADEIELNALDVGEVQPIELVVNASENVENGDYSFNITLVATSDH